VIDKLKLFLYGIAVVIGAVLMIIPIIISEIIGRLKGQDDEE